LTHRQVQKSNLYAARKEEEKKNEKGQEKEEEGEA
jgi:hypothetical protein